MLLLLLVMMIIIIIMIVMMMLLIDPESEIPRYCIHGYVQRKEVLKYKILNSARTDILRDALHK